MFECDICNTHAFDTEHPVSIVHAKNVQCCHWCAQLGAIDLGASGNFNGPFWPHPMSVAARMVSNKMRRILGNRMGFACEVFFSMVTRHFQPVQAPIRSESPLNVSPPSDVGK